VKQRWQKLAGEFELRFGDGRLRSGRGAVRLFSTPGRTEIGGNHTDHNWGKVLAAGVNLDSIAIAAPENGETVTVYSEGYDQPFVVALDNLSVMPDEQGTTSALIRGIAARYRQLGYAAGGFRACITSDVPVGSGLSSSASVEVLIATVLNALYNGGRMEASRMAIIGQYAENVYFGKPCGLMDQIACAVGGIVKIDFEIPDAPRIERVDFDFSASGYSLVVETGGSHADLTEDYASIPREMKAVAAQFGKKVCRQITAEQVLGRVDGLRARVGDRAILRALHYLDENNRVDLEVAALRDHDMRAFLQLVRESGESSYQMLQNCISPHSGAEQGIPLALALAGRFIRRSGGACRVHGGGFAGTIQAFVPDTEVDAFRAVMEPVFGAGSVKLLRIRPGGTTEIA
jgi:galactokinase